MNVKFKTLFSMICFAATNALYAQDIITLKDGKDIEADVLEVNQNEIKYKKFQNVDGPTYTVNISSVFQIKYKNGEKDFFGDIKDNSRMRSPFEVKKNGYCGMFEVGTNLLIDKSIGGVLPMTSLRMYNGGRLSKIFSMGVQIGADFGVDNYGDALLWIPINLAMRVNFIPKRVTPIFDFSTGYAFTYFTPTKGFASDYDKRIAHTINGGVALGVKIWLNTKIALNTKVGYSSHILFDKNRLGGSQIGFASSVPILLGIEF